MAGKYKCLLCQKEFVSESGVKYHINSVHAEVRSLLSPPCFCDPVEPIRMRPQKWILCVFMGGTVEKRNLKVLTRDRVKILCEIRCVIVFLCESI